MRGVHGDENNQLRLLELEALDQKRLQARQELEGCRAHLARASNKKVQPRSFQVRDQLRRSIITTHKGAKFTPKWEEPYVIYEGYTNGA